MAGLLNNNAQFHGVSNGLLASNKNQIAPYGVIIDGNRIIVGSPHGGPLQLSPDLQQRVRDTAKRYGAYYEGDGKDVAPLAGLLGRDAYRGSWDDNVSAAVKGYPVEFLSGLFSNIDVNKPHETFTDPKSTIFDAILKNQEKMSYFKDRKFDQSVLSDFLQGGSEKDADFISMSKMPATSENLYKFFSTGEKLMWPDNWQDYPNKLGKYAKKFEETRNQTLINSKPGVYFAGAGHLPELTKMNPRLRMIGGERASD